jgi:hypothetical protein
MHMEHLQKELAMHYDEIFRGHMTSSKNEKALSFFAVYSKLLRSYT